jgi:hypothetical protein
MNVPAKALDASGNVKSSQTPLYTLKKVGSDEEHLVSADSVVCFSDNKGTVFCPPEFPENLSGEPNKEEKMSSFFIKAYITNFNFSKEISYTNDKAVWFQISNTGKIDLPLKIYVDGSDEPIVNCGSKEHINYMQCKAIDKMADMNY